MKFATEILAVPNPYFAAEALSEADKVRRQAEIARCLHEFRKQWDAGLVKEPLADVIALDEIRRRQIENQVVGEIALSQVVGE